MSHLVLARKYRPLRFSDMVGQEIIVQILQNAMRTGKLGHAFLFHGVRGVGKTTTARLLARLINCTSPSAQTDFEPCNQCDSCRSILEDRHIDVIEMDAASHTSVEDVRPLIEAARYHPQTAYFKVYIIDEVHMLSKSAFNALLKTLEEPPAHLKFIFATTEIRRVPATILSRCIRFDLKRLDEVTLQQYFSKILQQENYPYEEEAIKLIARAADGSARDGLSLLDQFITGGESIITADHVRQTLGLTKTQDIIQLFTAVLHGDSAGVFQQWQSMYQQGCDAQWVLSELLGLVHDLIQKKLAIPLQNPIYDGFDFSVWLKVLTQEVLLCFWQILLRGLEEIRIAPSAAQLLDVILAKLLLIHPTKASSSLSSSIPSTPITDLTASSPEIKLAPTAVVTVAQNSHLPATFVEMIQLFDDHREPMLSAHLQFDVELIEYRPGFLSMAPRPTAPKNLVVQLTKYLQQWTGFAWQIVTQKERGHGTIQEQKQQSAESALIQAMQGPLAQAMHQAFPQATYSLSTEYK